MSYEDGLLIPYICQSAPLRSPQLGHDESKQNLLDPLLLIISCVFTAGNFPQDLGIFA